MTDGQTGAAVLQLVPLAAMGENGAPVRQARHIAELIVERVGDLLQDACCGPIWAAELDFIVQLWNDAHQQGRTREAELAWLSSRIGQSTGQELLAVLNGLRSRARAGSRTAWNASRLSAVAGADEAVRRLSA